MSRPVVRTAQEVLDAKAEEVWADWVNGNRTDTLHKIGEITNECWEAGAVLCLELHAKSGDYDFLGVLRRRAWENFDGDPYIED
jgi:hypothetical protein